jgi:hypothetical protein
MARVDAESLRAAAQKSAQLDAATKLAAAQAAAAIDRMAERVTDAVRMQDAQRKAAALREDRRRQARRRGIMRLIARDRARRTRRRRVLIGLLVAPVVAATGLAITAYFIDAIPMPDQLALPESTTVYFADGTTPMATLGTENRTILKYDDMNDAVKQAIVAAEDRTFWTNAGIDLSGVLRAAWNNATGGPTQGASTITQQYARIAADLGDMTYARKAREAVLAWKLDRAYSKEDILGFYLNTVSFGRGAYGIEAAAQTFFGKTAKRTAPADQQVTVAEAMLLACLVKQPEPDPVDPVAFPGYDPARGGTAAANAMTRWGVRPRGHGGTRLSEPGGGDGSRISAYRPRPRGKRPAQRSRPPDRPDHQSRPQRASPTRTVPGHAARLHPQRRLPDRDDRRQTGAGRGRSLRRHPTADRTGRGTRSAAQLAGRARRH